MKEMFVGVFMGILIGAVFSFGLVRTSVTGVPEPAFHEHADFAVFIDGEQFDFTLAAFMSEEPCVVEASFFPTAYAHGGTVDDTEAATELHGNVHLHDGIGNVIHVHEEGVTYGDFFESLGLHFDDESFVDLEGHRSEQDSRSEFRFYLNGEEVPNMADREIRNLDETLISFGKKGRSDADMAGELAALSNDSCVPSESCTHRPPAIEESCGQYYELPWLLKTMGLTEEEFGLGH